MEAAGDGGLVAVFSGKPQGKEGIREEEVEKLHAKIAQLRMRWRDWRPDDNQDQT